MAAPPNYSLTIHRDAPAIILTLTNSFTLRHVAETIDHLSNILDAANQPLYYINDIQGFSFNFGEMVSGMAEASRKGGVLRHPNLAGIIVVTDNGVAKMGANALSQVQYGNLKVHVESTIDAALNWIYAQE